MDRFANRLDPATHAEDDEVVGVFESDPSEAALAVGVAQSITDYLSVRTRRPGWDGSVTFEDD